MIPRLRRNLRRIWQRYDRRARARETPAPRLPPANEPVLRLPATHQAAAAGLVSPQVVGSIAYKNRAVSVPREGADADIVRFEVAFIKELSRRGIPFFVHCLWRDRDEQNRLFKEGRTRALWGQSAHNFGMAVDIVHYGRYWDLTEKEWAVIGLIGKEIARKLNLRVTWGGDWSFYDPAHWELADWKIRSGKAA